MAFRAAAVFLGLAGVAANQIEDSFRAQAATLRDASEAEYVKFNLKGEPAEELPVGKAVYMKAVDGPEAGAFLKGNIVKKGTEANTYDLHLWVGSVRQRERLNVPIDMILDAKPIDEKEAAEGAARVKREEAALELARKNAEIQEKAKKAQEEAASRAAAEVVAEANRKKAAEAEARRQEEARVKAEREYAAMTEKQRLEAEAKHKAEEQEHAKQAQEAEERQKAEEIIAKKKALRAKYEKVKAARKLQMAAQMSSMSDQEMREKLWRDAQLHRGALKFKHFTGEGAEEVNFKRSIKVAKAVHDYKKAKAAGTLAEPKDEPPLKIRVAESRTGKVLDMNIRKRMPMRTFMRIAAERLGLDKDQAKFMRKATRLDPDDLPMKLDMKNGETISVYGPLSEQTKLNLLRKRQA